MTLVDGCATPEKIQQLRAAEFPWIAETLYMNSAAIGPIPERTRRYLAEFNFMRAAPHRIDSDGLIAQLQVARETVARLVNADAAEIALTFNTSFGLNLAARALPLRPGDVVVLSDREFPANVYPWLELRHCGVDVKLVPTLPNGWPDEERLLSLVQQPEVRALTISLVQFSNGYRANMKRLSAACRAADCFLVVDGIQGIGQVPFDVKATPVDVVACGAQKWLLSPWGSGFVYVRKELLEILEPPMVGWMAYEGTEDFSQLTYYGSALRSNARRFEINTLPFHDLIAMSYSVGLLVELGIDTIQQWIRATRAPLLEAAERGSIKITSPTDPQHDSAILCVAAARANECWQRLAERNVVCSLREGTIRISPHCFNTLEEMERVASILSDTR